MRPTDQLAGYSPVTRILLKISVSRLTKLSGRALYTSAKIPSTPGDLRVFILLWPCILLQMKSLHPTQAHRTPFAVDINHLQVLLCHAKIEMKIKMSGSRYTLGLDSLLSLFMRAQNSFGFIYFAIRSILCNFSCA